MAANRAYLAGLGLGPQAIACGTVPAVPPGHPLTLAAARRLANTAALTQATNQARHSCFSVRPKHIQLEPMLQECIMIQL